MNLMAFLLVGLIAGWAAGEITNGEGFGFLGNIVIGILGALTGGFAFDLLGIQAYGFIGSLIMAILGSCLLLVALGWVRPRLSSGRKNLSYK